MVGQPSHVKQLSLNHVCKIGLRAKNGMQNLICTMKSSVSLTKKINLKHNKYSC
jgi:hypothetical protein